MNLKIAIILLTGLFSFHKKAVSQGGQLSGKVTDSSQQKPLSLATVSVFKTNDTSLVTYRMTNDEGVFRISGLPLGESLKVIVSYEGYRPWFAYFTLQPGIEALDLKTILLEVTSQRLEDVIVWAERPPVIIRKDTIEFNANSFKTLPNALVEDLLKKLPGIQIDGSGRIIVNGKLVNKILVDGKSFFGNDPKIATKNLPANIIDKVQVVDDEDEMLQYGKENLHKVGKVINLTFKKDVKKGWFGKMYAGSGSNQLYEYGALINHFRDTFQLSLLGYANNLNRPGFSFSDVMQLGGFNRSNLSTNSRSTSVWSNGSGSNLSINGVSFGGGQNSGGISTSRGGGFNLNHAPSSKKSIYFQYFLGDIHVEKINDDFVKQYILDSIITGQNKVEEQSRIISQNIVFGTKIRPDKFSTFTVNLTMQFNKERKDKVDLIDKTHSNFGPLSSGTINQEGDNDLTQYNHIISYSRSSKKRTQNRISILNKLTVGKHKTGMKNITDIKLFYPGILNTGDKFLRKQNSYNSQVLSSFSSSQYVIKNVTWRGSIKHEYFKQKNDVHTSIYEPLINGYTLLDTLRSNIVRRNSQRVTLGSGIELKYKEILITPGIQWLSMQQSVYSPLKVNVYKNNEIIVSPTLAIQYKGVYINYSQELILPDMTLLAPIKNDANPYFVTLTNFSLSAPKKNEVTIYVYHNNYKKGITFGGNAAIGSTSKEISTSIEINSLGGQSMKMLNVGKAHFMNVNYNIIKEFHFQTASRISFNTGGYYGLVKTPLVLNKNAATQRTFNLQQWIGVSTNYKDIIEWNSTVSVDNNNVSYDHSFFSDFKTFFTNYQTDLIIRYPKRLVWENSLSYSKTGNHIVKDITFSRWNSAINYSFGRNDKFVFKISVFDLLNAGKGTSITTLNNGIWVNSTNFLGRYFLMTMNFNIRKIGSTKRKVGQTSEKLFFF